MEASFIDKFYSVWNDSWVLSNVRRMRMGGNTRLAWTRQRKSWLSEPVSFFEIGVDLNGMSASEYLPLYQSFTNRMHIRNARRFDHSEISQTIEKNKWCVILSGNICGYVNLSITYILVSVLPGGWYHKLLSYLGWHNKKMNFNQNVSCYRII